MKLFKKMMALVVAIVMVLSMSMAVFAATGDTRVVNTNNQTTQQIRQLIHTVPSCYSMVPLPRPTLKVRMEQKPLRARFSPILIGATALIQLRLLS